MTYSGVKKELESALPTWRIDNPETKVKLIERDPIIGLFTNTHTDEKPASSVKKEIKKEIVREDSPDLMPESEDWLAAAVNLLGDDVWCPSSKQEVNEEIDELLDDVALDEPTPTMTVRPPDVVDDSYRDVDLSDRPFELDAHTLSRLFRDFNFKFEGLLDIPQLAPYASKAQKSGTKRKRADDAPDSRESDPRAQDGETTVTDNVKPLADAYEKFKKGVMHYPLTAKQLKVIKRCWRQTTLVFTHLPSHEQVLRLIALSAQVTIPYYGHTLFPNVRKVVFKSDVRLHSITQRYAAQRFGKSGEHEASTAHPLSFALDWIVDRFDACIHNSSAGVREHHIDLLAAKVKNEKGHDPGDSKCIAEQRWLDLDCTDDILDTASTPGLERLTIHGIQAGTKVDFNAGISVSLHFSPRSAVYSTGLQETLDSIVASTLTPSPELSRQGQPVRLYSFDNLNSHKKVGPKAQDRSDKLSRKLKNAFWQTITRQYDETRGEDPEGITEVAKRIRICGRSAANKTCATCAPSCEESTCVEQIVSYRSDSSMEDDI